MKNDVTSNAEKYCQSGRARRAAEHPENSQRTQELVAQAQFRMDAAMRETFLALVASSREPCALPIETLGRKPKPFGRTGVLSSRGTRRGTGSRDTLSMGVGADRRSDVSFPGWDVG
jgi:hypothetical protein